MSTILFRFLKVYLNSNENTISPFVSFIDKNFLSLYNRVIAFKTIGHAIKSFVRVNRAAIQSPIYYIFAGRPFFIPFKITDSWQIYTAVEALIPLTQFRGKMLDNRTKGRMKKGRKNNGEKYSRWRYINAENWKKLGERIWGLLNAMDQRAIVLGRR